MASVQKFTHKSTVYQLRHIERTIKNPSNKDIDKSKQHLDYSLSPERDMTPYDYYLKRKSELYCYGRDDVKVMAGWVVTAPSDLPASQQFDFFSRTYEFLTNRYGGEANCVEAIVHRDESHAHLHFYFIPTVSDPKHPQGEKICANDVLNRQDLRNFHPDLQRYLKENGIHATVHSGITKAQGGNRTVREMKQERQHQFEHEVTLERSRW